MFIGKTMVYITSHYGRHAGNVLEQKNIEIYRGGMHHAMTITNITRNCRHQVIYSKLSWKRITYSM